MKLSKKRELKIFVLKFIAGQADVLISNTNFNKFNDEELDFIIKEIDKISDKLNKEANKLENFIMK